MSDDQVQPGARADVAEPVSSGEGPAVAELQARIAQLEQEVASQKDAMLRAVADYKNFKRRTEAERSELIRSASAGLILKLLPVLDDFERAIASIPPQIAATPWWGGTQLIAHKLRTVLESEGVTPIAALGEDFNPTLHQAVTYGETGADQEGKVIEELQKGYRVHERVLRPSYVKVGRARAGSSEPAPSSEESA